MQQNQQSKKFVCQYNYLGKKWVLHIDAANHADAEERAKRLGTLEVLGELGGEVDAGILGASWMVRLKVWLLNFLPNSGISITARRYGARMFRWEGSPKWVGVSIGVWDGGDVVREA